MLSNIELYNPDFIIDCSTVNDSSEIYSIMRNNGIKKAYAYGMCFKPNLLVFDFVKIGMSHPSLGEKREYQVGERIVRQLSWVPGWEGTHVRSSHGSDFWLGVEHFLIPQQQLPATFNKNDIVVAVWDVTKRMQVSDISEHDDRKATHWVEGELVSQYKNKVGKLPMLNIQDPSKSKYYIKGYTPKSIWNTLFG